MSFGESCGGWMMRDSFIDLLDDTGRVLFERWRCINCGEVVDPVVLMHGIELSARPYRGQTRDRRMWERLTDV
ncbi:MAG: hypothetical protein OEW32_10645 [Nitrospira sp.]|nr:hypothetical protein [Nitrospira sp.]